MANGHGAGGRSWQWSLEATQAFKQKESLNLRVDKAHAGDVDGDGGRVGSNLEQYHLFKGKLQAQIPLGLLEDLTD